MIEVIGIAEIPENVCRMCMQPAGLAPEIVKVEVSYDCTFMIGKI